MPPARVVRADQVATLGSWTPGEPLVIEFQAGDVIPLQFSLGGELIASPEHADAIPLRVLRHFFLRVDKNGMKTSLDGVHFDGPKREPGSFQIGVGVSPSGVIGTIMVRTPTLKEQ
jgi:hypothetical protein